MEDINYGELFGIDEGGNEQETAEPAQAEETSAQGENEQETAEPAADGDTAADGADTPENGEPEKTAAGTEDEPDRQSPEQNARYAAARRKAEQERDAAIAQAKLDARAEADRYLNETIAGMGLKNPYTDKPITTKEEYDAYKAKFDEERRGKIAKSAGMNDEEFKRYIDELPEVRAAKAAAAQAQEAQAKLRIDEQLREIRELDPTVKELGDLTKMENYSEFYERVKRGMTLTEAYKLTNYERLTQKTAAASRQAAINNMNSKAHMTSTSARGTGAISVPADVKEMYLAFNPDATDAEIQAHYNKNHKS